MADEKLDPRTFDYDKSMTKEERAEFLQKLRKMNAYQRREFEFRRAGFGSYREYLDSPLWRSIRYRVLKQFNWTCAFCGGRATEVHHESYKLATLKGGDLSKLWAVCHSCHEYGEFDDDGVKLFPEDASFRMRQRARLNGIEPQRAKNSPPRRKKPKADTQEARSRLAVVK